MADVIDLDQARMERSPTVTVPADVQGWFKWEGRHFQCRCGSLLFLINEDHGIYCVGCGGIHDFVFA